MIRRPSSPRAALLLRGLAAVTLASLTLTVALARETGPAVSSTTPSTAPSAADSAGTTASEAGAVFGGSTFRDLTAARYLNSCAGCHSLTGLKLNGPELSPVAAWPIEQLRVAIKKMEPKVGPLSAMDVDSLAALLQEPNVRARLDAEAERIRAQFSATLEPADAAVGRALFTGRRPLRNGGMACTPCHRAGAEGGGLGPDLTTAFDRLGEAPLLSGIENANYRVMSAHYERHPVTKQEALHIATYLATFAGAAPAPVAAVPLLPAAALSALGLIGMVVYGRRGRSGRRTSARKER
jgi:mono/diheme cytochrome c family protein